MAIAAIAGLASVGGAMAVAGTFAIGFAAAATAFAIGAGLSIVSRALMPKPDFGSMMSGITGTVKEAAAPRKLIYGRCRVGGAVVFIANSSQNEYLHMVICYATHEVDAFEEFWFNDEKVWDGGSFQGDWASWATISTHDGTQTTADSSLVSQSGYWTSNHVLNGIAYAYVRLKWDKDRKKFPNGVPNISAVIRGKKVYDPRKDSTSTVYDSGLGVSTHRVDDSTTWEWSQNPALCIRDYMTDQKYGLAEDNDSINLSALDTAADICDQDVNLSEGGSHDRYACDGVIDTTNSIKANIEALLGCMGGRLSYSGGEYYIQASAYVTPTINIDESVMVGDLQVQTKQSRRSIYNGVKGTFLSEEENYTLADYPAQISSTYALEDGDPIYLDMPLPFVTNNIRAQRLAKIALLKSRQQTSVTIPLNLAGLKLKAGDFITITNERMGWDEKEFEVLDYSIDFSSSGEIIVNVNCIETASSVYDWATSDEQDFLVGGELTLNDGTSVPAITSLAVTETTSLSSDGTVLAAMLVTWDEPTDGFVAEYEVHVREITADRASTYFTKDTEFLVAPVKVSVTYEIKVRAINEFGVVGDWTTLSSVSLTGDQAAPATPTSLTAAGGYKQITLSWVNPTDLDFKNVEIYVSDGGSYTQLGVSSGETFVHSLPLFNATRYYQIRSVDFSGNRSGFTSAVSATTEYITNSSFEDGVKTLFEDQGLYAIENGSSLPSGYGAGDAGKLFFLTTDGKLYRWTGSAWTAAIADLTDLSGQITTTQIDDDAITTPKIFAGAITATELASDSVTTSKIVAENITGGLLATSGIITSAAQIDDAIITNAKIANAAVDTLTIAGSAVTVPVGTNATSSATLNTTMSQIGTLTVSWGSGVQPEAVTCIAGLATTGGSANQTLSLQLRRYFGGGAFNSVQLGETFASGEGGSTVIGGTFPITATSYNYVVMEIWANVSTGTKPCGSYFISAIGAKR